ncbi:hypothetical protein ACMFMG_004985 [Clarireedia jacksonii]
MSSPAGNCDRPHQPGDVTKKEAEVGILSSHGKLFYRVEDINHIITHNPTYTIQHQRSTHSKNTRKETLNARSEYMNNEEDGRAEHHINQYIIKDEIGRGSFGAVHLAVDQYGTEYAVKEFSKSRLRKRAQSNILRRPHFARRPGHLAGGINSPLHRHSASDIHSSEEQGNPLYLIKEEIAIMKKLNHPNLVSLIEVLDDPEEDSLYMVLEMCKKGVVMKVGLGEKADPYDVESCRCWFRDLILGIEYLHAQGVVHRDIKPDNLLLTQDDVLKIVDFGVSEMFEKASDMMTAKSAGSPAFLPPELCVTRHGDVSGRAADIWSMGISLYCLRFGRIPFERCGVLDLYEAIKNEQLELSDDDPQFVDLMHRLLEKDPKKRIRMEELRAHPWVTKNGTDPLLSAEENTADLVEPPSEIEVNHAITTKMGGLLAVMKAVKKFKTKLEKKRSDALSGTFGKSIRVLHPSFGLDEPSTKVILQRSKSDDLDDRQIIEGALAAEGIHHEGQFAPEAAMSLINVIDSTSTLALSEEPTEKSKTTPEVKAADVLASLSERPELRHNGSGDKGHAHDPLAEEPLYLGIGAGVGDNESLELPQEEIIAESPTAADFNIYDTAYQEEVERIRAAQGESTTVYLTRRVDHKKEYRADNNMITLPARSDIKATIQEGWKDLVDRAQEGRDGVSLHQRIVTAREEHSFSDLVSRAVDNTRSMKKDLAERGGSAIDNVRHSAMERREEKKAQKQKEKETDKETDLLAQDVVSL